MRLRRRNTVLAVGAEGTPPIRKGASWARRFYLLLIALLLGYVLYLLLLIRADGYVNGERYTIQSDRDAFVQQMHMEVGKTVRKGDPLFVLRETLAEDEWLKNETDRVRRELQFKRALVQSLRLAPAAPIIGGVGSRYARWLELDRRFRDTQPDNTYQRDKARWELDRKIDEANAEIATLDAWLHDAELRLAKALTFREKARVAPFDGVVFRVARKQYEFARTGDTVLELIDPARTYILAYVESDKFTRVRPGASATVHLPSGIETPAVITAVDSSVTDLPERLQMRYFPTAAPLRLKLVPARPEDMSVWRQFDQMDVSVTLSRF